MIAPCWWIPARTGSSRSSDRPTWRKLRNPVRQMPGGAFPLAPGVGFAEPVAAIGDGELAIRCDRRTNPMSLALRGVLEIGDHVRRRVVAGILIQQRQVLLPDAFHARRLRQPEVGISF